MHNPPKHSRKRLLRLKWVIKKKGKAPKVAASPPLLYQSNLLELLQMPVTLKEFMPEDFLQSLVITYNIASIVCDGNPCLHRESRPTPMPRKSTIVIDWLHNSLTYQDYYKRVTIPMTLYRYNISGISIAITDSIQDPSLCLARFIRLPITPWKCTYFRNVLTKFKR